MGDDIVLSVVDQSPMRKGGTAADALRETVALAQAAEGFGYRRYWVAEHHRSGSFTGTSPEILVGQIAASTNTIRVGSGGVMLTHYSALKVAEQFRVLNSFHPGRIDLGIGRAPGTDQLTAAALSYPRPQVDSQHFPRQVKDLLGFLTGKLEPGHPFAGIKAQPGENSREQAPEVWLLGSSDCSARLAALLGLPFSFAEFFGDLPHGPVVADLYRSEFKPSEYLAEPRFNVAVQALCAPTEEEAAFLGSSRNLNKAGTVMGLNQGLLPPEEAAAYPLTEEARKFMEGFRSGYIDGDPGQVREGILQVAERYQTKDISIVTNAHAHETRVRSYGLIAEAFGITPPAAAGG